MTRVSCYIDGFNLYHSIVDISKSKTPHANYLKWINLRTLAECFLKDNQQLNDVYYFSAYAKHVFDAYKRHEKYIKVLEKHNVNVILGQFKKKYPKCKLCNQQYKTHEEKESDINIALEILQDAFKNSFDKAFLITADSDLIAIVKKMADLFPKKEIILLIPPGRSEIANELKKNVAIWYQIKESHLNRCLLPKLTILSDGTTITRPTEYDSPNAL